MGELSGEYWIDSVTLGGDSARHLRVVSATAAMVNAPGGGEVSYPIEVAPGAALETLVENGRPTVHGPIVIRGTNEEFAFAEDPGDGTADALVVRSVSSCTQNVPSWQSGTGVVRRDADPTVVEGFLPVWIPWQSMALGCKKAAAAPLESGMTARSGGADVAISWSAASVAGDQVSVWATLTDGLGLVGQTITFSGGLSSTNGVASPVGPVDVPVFDFGPARTGALDFTAANPPELAMLGNPMRASSSDTLCPSGCLVINTNQGIGLRLTSPGSSLRIRATGGAITVQARAVGLDAADTTQSFDGVSEQDFPLPPGANEVFLTITVPYAPPMQNTCPVASPQTTRLLSVTPS